MKTAELTGALLNYWVALAGEEWKHFDTSDTMTLDPSLKGVRLVTYGDGSQSAMLQPNNPMRQNPRHFNPSTDWAHGGPIIERERIAVVHYSDRWGAHIWPGSETWIDTDVYEADGEGATPLIAAMRAYVASKFGNEVPNEVAS